MALGYADYVVTEAGFGADLGFEKFMHIKARFNDLEPHAAVLVASVRALKSHGGVPLRQLETPDVDAVKRGLPNLQHLIGMIKSFGLPVVVAMNYFPSDTEDEMAEVKQCAESMGATAAESRGFTEGGPGCVELAQALIDATDGPKPCHHLRLRRKRHHRGQGERPLPRRIRRRRGPVGTHRSPRPAPL